LREGKLVQSGAPRKVVDQPANLEVARLLGLYNLLAVEIRSLDPGNNSSRIRFGDAEFSGPYFPGRLKGDRVSLFMRPSQLAAAPRDGRVAPNQIPTTLERAIDLPHAVRLEFREGVTVEMPRADFERHKHNKDWVVEFPASSLRIL
jgi:ABC-type Fe3+/spermidine/putrescine transport system ATPase subunit